MTRPRWQGKAAVVEVNAEEVSLGRYGHEAEFIFRGRHSTVEAIERAAELGASRIVTLGLRFTDIRERGALARLARPLKSRRVRILNGATEPVLGLECWPSLGIDALVQAESK